MTVHVRARSIIQPPKHLFVPAQRRIDPTLLLTWLPALGLALLGLAALIAPLLGLTDPTVQSLLDRLKPPGTIATDGSVRLFGTDQLGRDVLSRIVHGARVSLTIAGSVVVIAGVVGSVLGLFVGYRRGLSDAILMRLADLQMAFPPLLLIIFLLYVAGSSLVNLALLLAALSWIGFARLARARTLSLRNQLFVEAAVAIGASERRIIFRHILPHVVPVLVVAAVFDFAALILAEAGLSFLGLGVQAPESSWGLMLAQGQQYVATGAWWLIVAPASAMFITTLLVNLASRRLQGAIGSHQKGQGS